MSTLYVVATPIGNLKDITLRAIEVLADVDLVVAENRERALKLLSHLGIKKPIETINGYNEARKAKSIAEFIRKGKGAALISGAGMPCISDPGNHVVQACIEAHVDVKLVPGPSAAAGAIAISGFFADRFIFYGFLPLKKGKKKRVFRELGSLPFPIVFYESPRRLRETLEAIFEELGERKVAVLKEMTKVHEEAVRGTVPDILECLGDGELLGEYTVILNSPEKQQ